MSFCQTDQNNPSLSNFETTAITSGAPMLVAADGHQQEVAHIFWIFEKVQKMKLLEQKN